MIDNNFDYPQHRPTGSEVDAKSWLSSSLSENDARPFILFVERFSELTFYREDMALLGHIQAQEGVELPKWLLDIRNAFAFVESSIPEYEIKVRFDEDATDAEWLDDRWFTLGLRGYANEDDKEILQRVSPLSLFPIGEVWESDVMLAINLADPNDKKVYGLTLEFLRDDEADDLPLIDSVHVVFESYGNMFGDIVAIKLPGGRLLPKV